jgi:predicted ester cyclase
MSEQDVLNHLLSIESEAATLVDDAQIEIDRRSVEYEKQKRTHYDECYNKEIIDQDALFEKQCALIQQDYQQQLDGYRITLEHIVVDIPSFSNLVEQFLFGEGKH